MLGLSITPGCSPSGQMHTGAGKKGEGEGAVQKCHRLTLPPLWREAEPRKEIGIGRGFGSVFSSYHPPLILTGNKLSF